MVKAPIVAPLKVVEAAAIVIGAVKAKSVDFSHLTTLPVWPARVKLAGVEPEQMVWLAEAVPPTEVGFIVIVTIVELTVGHTPLCTTALK